MPKERSLRDGNGRVARLARWLSQQPASLATDTLVLEYKEDSEWKRLQMWPRSEVAQQLAQQIDNTVTELANELGAYLTARVVWFDSKAQTYWTEHALRVQPEDMEGLQAFDGSAQSMAIQNQRHQEKMHTTGMGLLTQAALALRETNAQLLDSNRILGTENTRLREDLYTTRERVAELEQENARLTGMFEQAVDTAEAAGAKSAEEDKTGQVLHLITTAMQGAVPKG